MENKLENGNSNKSNKRELDFKGEQGKYLYYIANRLVKYFEDSEIEDFQINKFNQATLIKRGDKKEYINDNNLSKGYIKTLMNFVSAIAPKKLTNTDKQVSLMLPVNKFRFTGRIGDTIGSGVKISIRLNDAVLHHTYKDFGLSELEYNFLVKYISEEALSAFVIGGTGSGKTTFSNLLIQYISEDVIMNVVGDIHDYIFHGDQKVSEVFAKEDKDYEKAFDLLMRSNPERILIPELTVSNVNLILRSINSGHKGFMLTMHSASGLQGIAEAFAKNLTMSGAKDVDVDNIHKVINSNIDFLIYLKKHKGERVVEKVVINNLEVIEEAKELGIFGLKKERKKSIRKKRTPPAVLKVIKALKSGELSQRKIANKYG
ncbi:MAG: CpaF/VirB11 family protein, partial [Alphaproteobacteria bacterium]|nr:CpaF/VirB11 family protein [Alphaproteobacteria bacterium]